jgi:hypothetical protein
MINIIKYPEDNTQVVDSKNAIHVMSRRQAHSWLMKSTWKCNQLSIEGQCLRRVMDSSTRYPIIMR